jgi:hypothetical protein
MALQEASAETGLKPSDLVAGAEQIPENMVGRLQNRDHLRKLHRMLIKKKPPAPSVRRRTAAKRRVGKP